MKINQVFAIPTFAWFIVTVNMVAIKIRIVNAINLFVGLCVGGSKRKSVLYMP